MCNTNHEGYADPTATSAIKNTEGDRPMFPFMPIVFICSPFAGDVDGNTAKARNYSRFAADNGYIPFTKGAEVWGFGDRITSGMNAEIRQAKRKGKRIRYFTEDLKEV